MATLAAWAATQPFATEPWAQSIIILVGFIATSFGVSVTPNGFSESQMRKIEAEKAEIIGNTRLVVSEYDAPEPETTADDLNRQVAEFNQGQAGAS